MLLIRGCRVLTAAGETEALDILVAEGRIAAIGKRLEGGEAEVVAGEDRLALPGLINSHLHSSEVLLRGSYDRLPFDAWGLYVYPLFRPGPLPERLIYLRTALVAIESVRSGVTCVVDDVADETLSLDVLTAVFAAYRDVGLRCSCSGHVMDREPLSSLPYADELLTQELRARLLDVTFPEPAEYREFAEEAVRRFHRPAELARFVVAPVAPQWLTPQMLETCVEIAEAHALNLLMHVLETKEQALTSRSWGDGGFVEYLRRMGALRPGTTIAHGVWFEDGELDVLAETGCAVAHNPIANLRLGVGVAPVARMRDRGIPVGLGTDGFAINDRADLFEVMRSAALLSRCGGTELSSWLGAEDVLRAATSGGARCAFLEDDVGTLEVGAPADIALIRFTAEPLVARETVTSVVFSGGPELVETVIVNGRIVVRDGHVQGVNEDEIREELAEYVPFLRERQLDVETQNGDLRPALEAIHARSVAVPL
jgi:5-methylthioadenosine/S-adenosylhomocysteine deaminase